MRKAVYPGSFDPVTIGPSGCDRPRPPRIVDELVVGVLNNRAKTPLFSVEERVKMLQRSDKRISRISRFESFTGLSGRFCKGDAKPSIIVRGLRAITDFDYELQMAQTNRVL